MTYKRPFRRRLTRPVTWAMAALGLAMAPRASASTSFTPHDPVELSIIDRDTGEPIRTWRHEGRLFVAGEPGARYGLRVSNHTDGRVLVVMSVDGVNVLTGETASYNQRGYVFGPRQSYAVDGWRKSDTEIAAFTFAPLPDSYAARTGRPGDVGVIGIAVFKEMAAPLPPPPPVVTRPAPSAPAQPAGGSSPRQAPPPPPSAIAPAPAARVAPSSAPPPAAAPAPSPTMAALAGQAGTDARAASHADKLGTAHGAREWSTVTTTSFVRATPRPLIVRQIEYDTYANLAANGVIPPSAEPARPHPFPGQLGYVPDPPNAP